MKKIVFCIVALMAFALAPTCAQKVVSDTTFVTQQGSQYFSNRAIALDNGASQIISEPIGDKIQAFNAVTALIYNTGQTMAQDVQTVSQYRSRIGSLIRQAQSIQALTGFSPLDTLRNAHYGPMLVDGWRIRTDTGTTAIKFQVNASGNTRYQIATGQFRQLTFLGSIMRLSAYPSQGQSVDLYRTDRGNWINTNRSVILLRPGAQGANNIQAPSTSREVSAPEPEPKMIIAPSKKGTYRWDGEKLIFVK